MIRSLRPAVQVAKLSGYSPIITTASLRNEPLLKSLGATHVLDRSLPASAILAEIQTITGGKPVEYVFDAISITDTEALAYDALAPGGTLILVLGDVIPAEKKRAGDNLNKRVVQSHGAVHFPENRAVGVEFYKRLSEWLRTGVIVVRVRTRSLPGGNACADELLPTLAEQRRGPPERSSGDS